MIRNEYVEYILSNIHQISYELKDNLTSLVEAKEGETLFPQSDEETQVHDELADILSDILPKLDKIEEIADFYEGLSNAFGTYNPA